MNDLLLFLFLGTIFGLLGGLAAFLITYEEYQHHFTGNGKALKHSLETGAFAFFVFLGISVLAGFIFSNYKF
jgi:ABC-type antimicrobial peptide transport system permease subunit